MEKVKKLSLKKRDIMRFDEASSIKGGIMHVKCAEGCTDGCGGVTITGTHWNCTRTNCTADFGFFWHSLVRMKLYCIITYSKHIHLYLRAIMKNRIVIIGLFVISLSSCIVKNDIKHYADFIMQDKSISKVPIDSTTISDLALICKCWGFVKYYYPNIETIGIDINKELFEILDNYCAERNASKVLCQWIDSINQYKNLKWKQLAPKPLEYYSNANIKWIIDTTYISVELSERLNDILSYRRLKGNYSSIKSSGVIYHADISPTHGSLRELDNVKQRLLVLFTYWNVIEYYYCLKQPDLNWDLLLSYYLPAFISGNGEICYKELQSLASHLHDSHGIVRSNDDDINKIIPLNVRMADSLLLVVGESGNEIPIGSKILSVDDKEINDIFMYLIDSLHYNYSNHSSLKNAMTITGLFSAKDTVLINYSNNGIKSSLIIGTIDRDNYKIWEKNYISGAIKDCQLFDDICYLNAGSFERSKENKYLELLKKSSILIVDLRFYPNEMMIPFIIQYLIPSKTSFAMFDIPSWNNPGFSKSVTPRYRSSSKYSYDGRIVILVNENTFSQGEYTAMALQANSRSITIGTETCGSDGDMSLISLPGGIYAYFTGLGVYYPNGNSTQRQGIKIDRTLDPTILDTMYYKPLSISKYIKSMIIN